MLSLDVGTITESFLGCGSEERVAAANTTDTKPNADEMTAKLNRPVLNPQPDLPSYNATAGSGNSNAQGLSWFKKNRGIIGDTRIILSCGG